MPAQTTLVDYIAIPDGCAVEVDADGGGYDDLGATSGDVTATLEYDVNKVESANAGVVKNSIRNMRITGAFELMNLNPELVEKLGGGMFTRTSATGSVDPDDQVMTTPAVSTLYDLQLISSAGVNLRPASAPTITSVTASSSGVLADGTGYEVVADPSSVSGYSIIFITGAITGSENVTIVYPSQAVNSSQTLAMGKTTDVLTSYKMRLTHTDDNSKIRRLELFSVNSQSGGFQFNFKGATSDGAETMPVTFEATLDTSLTNGAQLAEWTYEAGAE